MLADLNVKTRGDTQQRRAVAGDNAAA
jgi:hypothetical protein